MIHITRSLSCSVVVIHMHSPGALYCGHVLGDFCSIPAGQVIFGQASRLFLLTWSVPQLDASRRL